MILLSIDKAKAPLANPAIIDSIGKPGIIGAGIAGVVVVVAVVVVHEVVVEV